MSELKRENAEFIGCDYKEITASGEQIPFYLDCYQNFDWVQDEAYGKVLSKDEAKALIPKARG